MATMQLGERLKIARESLGLDQKSMALKLEIGLRSWQGYEAGAHYPGGEVFESLARMGFNSNWLLTGEGPMMRGETSFGPAQNMSFDTPGNRDPDLLEIVEILENDPESKDFVLMILRGRKQIKAGMAGLGLKLQND